MNKKVIAVAVAASLVVVALWYVAVFSPQSHSIHKARSQAVASKQQAVALRSQIAVLEQEKTQLPAATAKLSTLSLALPNTPVLDKLIDDINAAAVQTGVDWQNITPAKPTTYTVGGSATPAAPGGLQAVSVSLQVDGTYSQVKSFITQLSGLSRLLTVDGVNLNGVGNTVAKTTAQLSTQIFFVPPTTTTPTTVAP